LKTRTKIALALVVTGAALIGGALSLGVLDRADAKNKPAAAAAAPKRVTPVEAEAVQVGTVVDSVQAVGSLRSNESVVLRPEIAGRISRIHFTEGQTVRQGMPLIDLDDALYRAEVAEAEAKVNLSQRNYDRARELYTKKVSSARDRDEALAQLEIDQASLELAKVRLDKSHITAPFDGIVGLRQVSVGSYVKEGQDMVNIENIDPIKVDFRLPERFLTNLRKGQKIEIRVGAFPDDVFSGHVYALDPLVDADGRSVALRASIDNSSRRLRPGLFAHVTLMVEAHDNAITVPEQAVVPRGDQRFVFKVVDDKAVSTPVELGIRRDGRVEVTSGLVAGDVVVTAGQQKIRDGSPVSIAAPDSSG
jgi:membrane fusion protein, multidrug efflux system